MRKVHVFLIVVCLFLTVAPLGAAPAPAGRGSFGSAIQAQAARVAKLFYRIVRPDGDFPHPPIPCQVGCTQSTPTDSPTKTK